MYLFTKKIGEPAAAVLDLALTFEQRQKSLLRLTTEEGRDVGIRLPRGELPELGSLLITDQGIVAAVHAAPEALSVAYCDDALLFSRACYHLGNRHVKLEIQPGRLSYLHDHVLDEMLQQLGLTVSTEHTAFCPESGAYAGGHAHHH